MKFSELSEYWERLEGEESRNKITEVLAEVLKKSSAGEIGKVCYLSLGRLGPLYNNPQFNLGEKLMVRVIAQAAGMGEKKVRAEFKKAGDLGGLVENLYKNKDSSGIEIFSSSNSPALSELKNTPKLERAGSNIHSSKNSLSAIVNARGKTSPGLSVGEVYNRLLQVAKEKGAGSVERKIIGIGELFGELDPRSAKYVARIPVGKMRLGFSDKTILDALSFMEKGDKSAKKTLEQAYKVRPDIGKLAGIVKEKGVEGVRKVQAPKVGVPILMAQAKRMSSAKEILDKIGKCAVEPKIDGFRLQCHYVANTRIDSNRDNTRMDSNELELGRMKVENDNAAMKYGDNGTIEQSSNGTVRLFTRNLDNVTHMYPDIVEAVRKQIKAESVIFEGEAVAYNPQTGEYLPFQETVQRKRKYDIEKFAEEVPLKLIAFDCLYLNGKDLLSSPYKKRRRSLEQIIGADRSIAKKSPHVREKFSNKGGIILLAEMNEVDNEEELERLFEEAVSEGLEGVMAKRLDAPYQAGARNWNWIKYKRSYSSELTDTVDCLVMGYDYGKGKRAKFGIGAFLVGVYDKKNEVFKTVSKIGTGLSDEQWRELKVKSQKSKVKSQPKEYEAVKEVEADVWLMPELVVEIEADEITKSPVHTAGLALRFPRLKRFREDKRPEQATSLRELKNIYKSQRKQNQYSNSF